MTKERGNNMNYGILSLLPPIVAVILAIWSKNVILSLFCGLEFGIHNAVYAFAKSLRTAGFFHQLDKAANEYD